MKKKNQKVTKFKIPSLRNSRTGTQHPSVTPEQYLMFTLHIKLFTEGWRTGIKEKENFRKNHKWNVWTWERGRVEREEILRTINFLLQGSYWTVHMAVETTHSLLVALNLALSPWPRYPERQSPCQGLKFCISFSKQFSRWVLLLSEVGTFKPLYTHSQRDAQTEYPLSCVTKGRVSWEWRQLGDKTPRYLLSRVVVVMEVLSLLISCPVSPCPSWFSSHCLLGLTWSHHRNFSFRDIGILWTEMDMVIL